VNQNKTNLLDGAPRLFGIVADPDDDGNPQVVAWGHELPDQAVVIWQLSNGKIEIGVHSSADEALATAQQLYPARLLWASLTVAETIA
jgi:hypothetical protein